MDLDTKECDNDQTKRNPKTRDGAEKDIKIMGRCGCYTASKHSKYYPWIYECPWGTEIIHKKMGKREEVLAYITEKVAIDDLRDGDWRCP